MLNSSLSQLTTLGFLIKQKGKSSLHLCVSGIPELKKLLEDGKTYANHGPHEHQIAGVQGHTCIGTQRRAQLKVSYSNVPRFKHFSVECSMVFRSGTERVRFPGSKWRRLRVLAPGPPTPGPIPVSLRVQMQFCMRGS